MVSLVRNTRSRASARVVSEREPAVQNASTRQGSPLALFASDVAESTRVEQIFGFAAGFIRRVQAIMPIALSSHGRMIAVANADNAIARPEKAPISELT